MKRIIVFIFLLLVLSPSFAQNFADKAIELAKNHQAMVLPLSTHKGWTAAAYSSHNAYGIWRVQFWDGQGEALAWANVDPVKERVFVWYYEQGPNELELQQAEKAISAFLATDPNVIDLLGDVDLYDLLVDYRSRSMWRARIRRGVDSVEIYLDSKDGRMRSLENLRVIGINFPGIVSFDEWKSGNEANIVATAFAQAEIAKSLRGLEDWTYEVNRQNDVIWLVKFMSSGKQVASAKVDSVELKVLEFTIY